jgi:hypothetical protein
MYSARSVIKVNTYVSFDCIISQLSNLRKEILKNTLLSLDSTMRIQLYNLVLVVSKLRVLHNDVKLTA